MSKTNKLGWIIQNGTGVNHHVTAIFLLELLDNSPDTLPDVPPGYTVIIAPVGVDKPFGLRCALVRVLSTKFETTCEVARWATERFGLDVDPIYCCTADDPSEDAGCFFVPKMREEIAKLPNQTKTPGAAPLPSTNY